jgi:hypothetical protein
VDGGGVADCAGVGCLKYLIAAKPRTFLCTWLFLFVLNGNRNKCVHIYRFL